MSEATQEQTEYQPTSALPEHAWLHKLVGEWSIEGEAMMGPGGEVSRSTGYEKSVMFGDLWVMSETDYKMEDGSTMRGRNGLGFDVSFKEYRAFWVMDVSSHLWKSTGTLSDDGNTMTLDCVGPNMEVEGETASYRDTITFQDADHRTVTSQAEMPDGTWYQFSKASYTRVK